MNAQIVRADGTISEPIIIGTAGFTHSHQPFAIGDDSWGIAWDGNEIGGSEGTNVAIFNNDGEKIGSYFDVKDNYLIQGSADTNGNILLTSFESSGGSSPLNTQVLKLDPSSLGLFEARIIVFNGEARAEVSSLSLPNSGPYLSGSIEWSSDGKVIETISASEPLALTPDLIGKSLSAKVYALNAVGGSAHIEIKSNEIIEALDTNNFIPLLSEKQSEIVIELPETADSSQSITYLHAHHDAGIFTFTQGGERKFVIPAEDNSDAILGVYDYGYPQQHDIIKTANGGYLVTYEEGSKIFVAELNSSLQVVEVLYRSRHHI